MSSLRILLIGFGFVFGALISLAGLLINWAIGPYRTIHVDGDYGTLGSVAIIQPMLIFAIVIPPTGAILGWLLSAISNRYRWELS